MFRPGHRPDGEGTQGALACSAVTSNVLTWEEVKILSMWEKDNCNNQYHLYFYGQHFYRTLL